MDTDTPLDRKAIITDPVSKETLTTEEILVLVDSLPIDGKHISNEVLGSRKLSLHSPYTGWMSVDLSIKLARIRRLRQSSREEAARQRAEREEAMLPE
jgi:hypothetical protein